MGLDRQLRPATQSDVAREVGVSRTLVSFAFRDAPGVSGETKRAIFDAAKRLDYRPNAAAADLARKPRSAVGYDNSRTGRLHGIDLTSVDLHAMELGSVAGAVAMDRINNPKAPLADQRLTPELVVRNSTASARR